jgi:hypothetical protein
MAKSKPIGQVPSKALQPEPKLIPNDPASSVAGALANNQKQINNAKAT